MRAAEPGKSPVLLAYEAETARLKALTEFLGAFAPALAERAEPGTEDVGCDLPAEMDVARTEAIVESFRAVAIIAQSWPPFAGDADDEPMAEGPTEENPA